MKQQIQQALIDPLQFRFDVFPGLRYSPFPGWDFMNQIAGRERLNAGTLSGRIAASGSRTALDIGCNVGFFCFALAEMGIAAVGVDAASKELRIAAFTRRKLQANNVGLLSLHVTPDSVGLLPACDSVLLLSVWHHWVRSFGFQRQRR